MALSRCPRCGARGVRIADRRVFDGFTVVSDYCGQCGKNWPQDAALRDSGDNVLKMRERTARPKPEDTE